MSQITTLTLLISGKQGSGKTTLAKELCRRAITHTTPINLQYMKFADPLYAMQLAIQEVLRDDYHTEIKVPDGDLLQVLGTEWGRKKDPDFWVKILQNRVHHEMRRAQHFAGQNMPTLFMIDDARFPNELEAIGPAKGELGHKLIKLRLVAAAGESAGRRREGLEVAGT